MALILKLYIYNTDGMKTLRQITILLLMLVLVTSFSQCSSAQRIDTNPPMAHGKVYAQEWTAGVKEGGSGINIFIPIQEKVLTLDSMYFRKQIVKLEFNDGDNPMYIGRFKTDVNKAEDIILSSDMSEESKNTLPQTDKDIPFELDDDECVVSYKKGNRTHYYKISNITFKAPLHFPSAPKNGQ